MLFDLIAAMRSGSAEDLKITVSIILLSLPVILLALCVHEVAHGYVASKLGDPTAKSMGRLTLNPLKHLDPFGFLAMLCFGFGWARPVPINPRYFKKPRQGMAICALAGPISNILMALLFSVGYKLLSNATGTFVSGGAIYYYTELGMADFAVILCYLGVTLNISLAIFNLLPIPPLDGSKVLYTFLPPKTYFNMLRYEQYITIGFFLYLLVERYLPLQPISMILNYLSDLIYKLFDLILFFI